MKIRHLTREFSQIEESTKEHGIGIAQPTKTEEMRAGVRIDSRILGRLSAVGNDALKR